VCFYCAFSCVLFCRFITPGHCFFVSYVFSCLLFSLFVCTVVLFATFWVNKDVYIIATAVYVDLEHQSLQALKHSFRKAHHGLCGSNELLYKRCGKSMGRPKFRPPLLPHFSTDFNETWNQERYPGYDPTCKIWLIRDDGKGVCVGRAFSVTFCVLSIYPFFVFLLTPTGNNRRPLTTVYGSKRVFLRKVSPFVSLDDKK